VSLPKPKPGLGRGLGQLMRGQHAVGPVKPSSAAEPVESMTAGAAPSEPIKVEFGRGLNTLVTAAQAPKPERPRFLLPAWFFFAADVLLLAFTASICSDGAWDLGTVAFCVVSVSVALLLGLAGVLRSASEPSEGSPQNT
jgi:hypothetical protein